MPKPMNRHPHPSCPLGAPASYGVGTLIHEELPGASALRPEEIPEQVQGRGGEDRPLASLQRGDTPSHASRRAWDQQPSWRTRRERGPWLELGEHMSQSQVEGRREVRHPVTRLTC